MRVGDNITVPSGDYAGASAKVIGIDGKKVFCQCTEYWEDDEGYDELSEDQIFMFIQEGKPKKEIELIDREIQEVGTRLRGLLLKRRDVTDPVKADKEIRKLLSCIKL